jgi:hypothetical protein
MYQEVFNRLMKLMRPFMKQQDFTSRGNNFYKHHVEGNIGIINFQKNRDGLPKFTINIGIYSLVLAEFFLDKFNQKKVTEHPLLGDYHWDTRIGSLVPREHPARQKDEFWQKIGDKWWEYDDTTDVEELFNEISSLILDYGIPAIDKHLSDKQLIDEWFTSAESTKKRAKMEVGELRAATERARVQILRDLSVLLLAYNEKEQFKMAMSEFHEYLQRHPEYTGLKEDYDKLIKEPTFSIKELTSEK